jgi:hypothetical protein
MRHIPQVVESGSGLLKGFLCAGGPDQEHARGRLWNRERFLPTELWHQRHSARDLSCANEESQARLRAHNADGDGDGVLKPLHSAQGNDVGGTRREVFRAANKDIGVRQCNCASYFSQKGTLLLVGLDQRNVQFREAKLYGNSWKPGTGAYINKAYRKAAITRCDELLGSKYRFAEMTGQDLLGLAHRGEIQLLIPAQEYIDVRRYMSQLIFRHWGRKKGREKLRDASEIHG